MTMQCAIRSVWLALAALAAVTAAAGASSAHADDARASTATWAGAPLSAREILDADESEEQDDSGRKDNLQLGGVIGAGFPRPLAIEAMVKVQRLVAVGVEYSLLPEITISGVHTSFWAVAADMRVFPARNGFFIGLRAGRQHLAADTILAVGGQLIPIDGAVQTTFLNPRLGMLWTWSSGITLGIDAGLQIPVSSRTSGVLAVADGVALPQGQGVQVIDRMRSVTDYLGRSTIPTVDLLRVGLLL